MRSRNRSETGSAGKWRQARRCAALMLLPLLSGCVAAAIAVPAMTVAGAITDGKSDRGEAEKRSARAPAEPVAGVPPELGALESGTVVVTSLTALPPPTPADVTGHAADPWRGFVDHALKRSAELKEVVSLTTNPVESALLAPEGISSLMPHMRPCGGREPAVIIDLDEGPAAFSPESATTPSPGLAEGLARLREAGFVVLWISGAGANRVTAIGEALRRAGLDPEGRDPILLVMNEDDRKQSMREEANKDVCVLAIAGDQRADFDELFDYLRTPDAAVGLERLIGSGWFITPLPLASAPTGTE